MTIVELIVAVMVLSTGLLALAGTSIYVTRQIAGGSRQTVGSHVAQARFDSLASVRCASLPTSGSLRKVATTRGIQEIWTITDGNDIKSVIDSVRLTRTGRYYVYSSIIQCRDL